jgi:hypothetical protein
MTHDQLVVRAMLRKMHPDMFETSPTIDYILKCWDQRDKIQVMQEFWISAFEDGILTIEAFEYMMTWTSTISVTCYDERYNIDVEATTLAFAKIVKWARSKGYGVTKDYTESSFYIRLTVPGVKGTVDFYADRDIMCTKRHVGTEIIPAQPEKVVDKYDWDCDKVSFLGIDTDD